MVLLKALLLLRNEHWVSVFAIGKKLWLSCGRVISDSEHCLLKQRLCCFCCLIVTGLVVRCPVKCVVQVGQRGIVIRKWRVSICLNVCIAHHKQLVLDVIAHHQLEACCSATVLQVAWQHMHHTHWQHCALISTALTVNIYAYIRNDQSSHCSLIHSTLRIVAGAHEYKF